MTTQRALNRLMDKEALADITTITGTDEHDTIDETSVRIMVIDPDPGHEWGAIGVKWLTTEGKYGYVMQLPPRVWRQVKSRLSV